MTKVFFEQANTTKIVDAQGLLRGREITIIQEEYLFKVMPILQCMIWEKFHKEVKEQDSERYNLHFTNEDFKLWHNAHIKEISCIRNAIIHDGSMSLSKAPEEPFPKYIDASPKQRYPENTEIIIKEEDIDGFFRDLESAFKVIVSG